MRFFVVGASNDPEKYGSKVFRDLRDADYRVVPINLREAQVHGTRAYPSLSAAVRDASDALVVLVVPPAQALLVVEEAAALGIRRAWFQPGSESPEALAAAAAHGVETVSGACVMVERRRGHRWLVR